jgi:flagellar hook protein FlgE
VVTAPIQVYDSQGTQHDLTATFTKTANNTWSYSITLPAADTTAGGTTPVSVATGTLDFDANGNLTTPTFTSGAVPVAISGLADGAANMSVNWNLYSSTGTPSITQYAEASSVNSTKQDGYAAGTVSGVSLQNGGGVQATYTNGQQIIIGQLAVAQIANPSSLSQVGGNNLAATANTSTPVVGAAGTGGRGTIVAGALESSTVDIAAEFANLLTFQRSYQANSRVITTADQLTQETVNLIHS